MSQRLKIGLVILGLLIVLFAIAALAYAYWPLGVTQIRVPVDATQFKPP